MHGVLSTRHWIDKRPVMDPTITDNTRRHVSLGFKLRGFRGFATVLGFCDGQFYSGRTPGPSAAANAGDAGVSPAGPIRRRNHGYILTMDQSYT
eukprot:7528800-Pyramimonas_sp.AAC.1